MWKWNYSLGHWIFTETLVTKIDIAVILRTDKGVGKVNDNIAHYKFMNYLVFFR